MFKRFFGGKKKEERNLENQIEDQKDIAEELNTIEKEETVDTKDEIEEKNEIEEVANIDEVEITGEENEDEIVEVIDEGIEEEIEEVPSKKGFFARLKEGLTKTRDGITKQIDSVLKAFVKIDDELFDELEEILITSDVGVETSLKIIENLKAKCKEQKLTESSQLREILKEQISEILGEECSSIVPDNGKQTIILVIGVNGAGKTTTIGKIGYRLSQANKKVLFAAADTFRAAAIDQLQVWGQRTKIEVIKHNEGSDPGAVVFDAIKAAKARNTDVLICDTAGRLHNKKNLMEELKKISKIIDREFPEANKEVFLVLDSTTGQNALSQAKLFNEVADITGIILTKLDGTAKGGIVIAIKDQMDIPVKLIGVGEKMYDLQEFNPSEFVKAMFD